MVPRKLIFWSQTVALSGFLFGMDTAVISGAEQAIQKLWGLNVFQHGLTVSIALMGTVIGALLGGIPCDVFGRKRTLYWIAVLFLISSIGSALANNWYVFLFFRLIGGFAVGASSVAGPMYISELAPASHRGRLVMMFQFNVVLGILFAFVSNYLLVGVSESAWRLMLGVIAIPSLILLILMPFITESTRWLIIKKGAVEEAEKVFRVINPVTAKAEVQAIQNVNGKYDALMGSLSNRKYSFSIMLAVFFAIFYQVSGINAIIYYAPRIFEMTGLGTSSALLSSAGIGLINFLFTLLAVNYIDRFGRKKLMLVGSTGLIVSLALIAKSFYLHAFSGYSVSIYLFIYIAFFAFSQGAVIWVFISEIFPNEVRAKGQALGSFMYWLMASIITFSFPYLSETFGGGNSFMIFTLMMVCQLVFVLIVMPETNGKSLEELEGILFSSRKNSTK